MNLARMSAPAISAGAPTVNYGRSADLQSSGGLHAIPTRREHFVSPRSSGGSIETATHYKIKPERDSGGGLAPPKAHGRSRRNTMDASMQPIIVTPTSRYNVVVGEPSSARASRDSDIHDYREDGYIQPASSQHRQRDRAYSGYRGSSRNQHTIDNADISQRHPHDREAPQDRLLRVGSARDGQMYPKARPITNETLVRHPDTVKDDYGDNGYGYTNPKDLVEYDLETTNPRSSQGAIPQRSRSRRESWDSSRGGRPVSVSGYADVSRSYGREERERGPPPSTRGFDRIPGDRDGGTYHLGSSVHMPRPHDHISSSPLAQAPSSAYPGDNLGVPQRRTSTRRPVSVYNDDRDRDRRERDRMARDDYDIVDGRPRAPQTFETHEGVQTRGFGIRPDLMPPGNVVTVQPPAAMDSRPVERAERVEREDERLAPRNREDKRYHDSDERRYHASDRGSRRDDRDRSERRSEPRSEPRPDHDDRDRKIGAGIAAGSIAAAAMGVGASAAAVRESRNSDEDRDRDRERRHRRDSDQYYNERPRRNTVRADEPPVIDLSGRDPIERTSPREDRGPREPRERDREYRDDRAHDSDSRRERDRDSDNGRRDPAREGRRESPLQSEKVDLSDRYPVIERNVAKEDSHYPSDASRSSPPVSRRERDRDYDSDSRGGQFSSRRDRVNDEATIGRETISSPIAMDDKEARDLRALREDMGLDRAVDDSRAPPRPSKEPLDRVNSPPTVSFSRQSTDRISERPLDPPSRQTTGGDDRSFVPPALSGEYSAATTGTTSSREAGTTSSRDSLPQRPRFTERDRGYSSSSTSSSSSGSGPDTPRERSRERTRQSVQVVSPPRSPSSSQATLPVKGILKPPRVFPELPAEERPGVAPLIDKKTGKNWDGREMADVPPSARWTKISRKLVNPEALEKGKERYEVRDDFVVVLRVLTKDEIQGYAVITQNIRAQREDEEREERRRRRGGDEETDVDRDERRRRRRDDDEKDTEADDTRDERRRRRKDDDETEDERAERKRKERERDERRRKYEDEETSDDREVRKAKEREERHRRRREERYRSEPREDETADQAEERRRREREERRRRHRERRERDGGDEDYAKEREERHRRHRERRERERERERENESDTTDDERDDRAERRRRRRERERERERD